MGKVMAELSMSLDGFVAGPNDSPENPLGDGGEQLFQWYYSGQYLRQNWEREGFCSRVAVLHQQPALRSYKSPCSTF